MFLGQFATIHQTWSCRVETVSASPDQSIKLPINLSPVSEKYSQRPTHLACASGN